ncbi:MAG: S16 family serine protease, partial [Syntrophobacteria bacterium]
LPVGGVRGKILAARRAGVKTAIFPEKNRVDLEDLDDEIRGDLEVIFCRSVEEVIDLVLG